MKVKDAAKEAGLTQGMLYGWIAKKQLETKTDDEGVTLVSLDAVKGYRKKNPPRYRVLPKGRVLSMQVTGKKVKLPGRVRAMSEKNLAQREALKEFAKKLLTKGDRPTPFGLMKLARAAGIPAGTGTAAEILDELRPSKKIIPSAKELPVAEYTTRTFLALLESRLQEAGIEALTYNAGATPMWTWKRTEVGEM